MSAPAPATLNAPFAYDAPPASPVEPTSWCVHGLGSAAEAAAVVNDQTGPVVLPVLFFATTCQKYVVFAKSEAGAYEDDVWPDATCCDGGFAVPNRTSYEVAPEALHVSVGVALTLVA